MRIIGVAALSLLLVCQSHADETISTSSITASAMSMSCIDYKVVGACFWLVCGASCKVKVSPKVGHYNPDLVISAHNGIANNPWTEANAITGTASKSVLNTIISAMGGVGTQSEAGGNRTSQNSGEGREHQALKFKDSDAIGHPVASIPIGYRCPSQAQTLFPYFISGADTMAWRFGLPETIYPQALIPGRREVGHFPTHTWGSVYPRSGFINQTSDPKAGAVIAQRAGDIVTRKSQPHVYSSVIRSVGGQMKTWPPSALIEGDKKTGKWQMLTPKQESSCSVFGDNDLAAANGWGGGKVATSGNYAWTLWRPYKCCQRKGIFLYSIDFISYP